MKIRIMCLFFALFAGSAFSQTVRHLDASANQGFKIKVDSVTTSTERHGRGLALDVYANVTFSNPQCVPTEDNLLVVVKPASLDTLTIDLIEISQHPCPAFVLPTPAQIKVLSNVYHPADGTFAKVIVNGIEATL